MGPLVRIAVRRLGFHHRLIRWLTVAALTDRRTQGDLTGQTHEPFSRGENTKHPSVWRPANRICRPPTIVRGRWGPPCFTESRWLALRRGRNVLPPQVLFPGSFATTF